MRERIRELWIKAAESTAAYPSGQNNSWETQVNFIDKFAELIVRECMDVVDTGDNQLIARFQARQWLSEHFGVE